MLLTNDMFFQNSEQLQGLIRVNKYSNNLNTLNQKSLIIALPKEYKTIASTI